MAVSKHDPYRLRASDSIRTAARRTWHGLAASVMHPVRSGLAKVVLVLAVLVGLYALAGFVLAPRLLRSYLVDYAQREYGRQLSLGVVRVNPFKFSVELEDLGLPDADAPRLLAFERLFVDFEPVASLWERAWVFGKITLERPYVRVVVRPEGTINLADLAGKSKPDDAPPAGEQTPVALWIQALRVEQGTLAFIDQDRPHTFERTIAPLGFSLRNFRTTASGGSFDLAASLSDGAKLGWRGKVSVAPHIASSGQLALSGFPLRSLQEYEDDALTFRMTSGTLDLQGGYDVSWGKKPSAELNLPSIAVHNVTLQSRDRNTTVEIPSVAVADTKLSLLRRDVTVTRVVVDGLATRVIRVAPRALNVVGLASDSPSPKAPSAPADDSAKPSPKRSASSNPRAWSAKVGSFQLQRARATFEDQMLTNNVEMEVAPIDVTLKELSLDLAKPVPVTASARLSSGGQFSGSGTVTPYPFAFDLDVHAKGVALAPGQPYLLEYVNVLVRDGLLDVDGKIQFEMGAAEHKVSLRVDAAISGFRTLDSAQRQDFVGFDRLEVKRLQYDSSPTKKFAIDRINLRKPYLRLILSERPELNVVSAFGKPPPPGPARAAALAEVAEPPAAAPAPRSAEQLMPIYIGKVAIQAMRVNFSDYFSQPHFFADVQQLTGTLRNLSSDPKSRATFDLKGRLGAASSVSLTGKLQPFAYDKQSDVQLVVKNISLPIFNPYSGRYAGYNIARGELATDIHYKLRNRKLEATHKIRVDQLEWGAETATQEEAPVPVKLATVLLRDRHGVIHLDVPVDGTLDDPEFRVWPIIWQVVGNILLKAVMAPFDLLGSLFEGSEKARYIDFEPGASELSEPSQQALGALAQVLIDKPELLVDVPIVTVEQIDRPGLVEQKLEERLAANLRAKHKGDGAPAFDSLPPNEQVRLLSTVYDELTGKRISLPPGKPDVDSLRRTVLGEIHVSAEELTSLGRRRGEAIEAALMGGAKLDATRVLLTTKGKATAEQGKVRFELFLH